MKRKLSISLIVIALLLIVGCNNTQPPDDSSDERETEYYTSDETESVTGVEPEPGPNENETEPRRSGLNTEGLKDVYVVPEGTFLEEHELSEDEAAFLALLNSTGLDWRISSRQSRLTVNTDEHRNYFVSCPENLINGLITIRRNAGHNFGDKHISLAFSLRRSPTVSEAERLYQQQSLLSSDEWNLLWELAGTLLEEEEAVADIAARAFGYSEGRNIMRGRKAGNDIDYRFSTDWREAPLEINTSVTIELTLGMCEIYREMAGF